MKILKILEGMFKRMILLPITIILYCSFALGIGFLLFYTPYWFATGRDLVKDTDKLYDYCLN